jgi:hypothetical protein
LRLKAYILTLLFLLGSNGISIDIATCCDSISGFSIGFQSADNHLPCNNCTSCVSKTKSSCCDLFQINTVINPVLFSGNLQQLKVKDLKFNHFAFNSNSNQIAYPQIDDIQCISQYSEQIPGVPILLKKRVLQI